MIKVKLQVCNISVKNIYYVSMCMFLRTIVDKTQHYEAHFECSMVEDYILLWLIHATLTVTGSFPFALHA